MSLSSGRRRGVIIPDWTAKLRYGLIRIVFMWNVYAVRLAEMLKQISLALQVSGDGAAMASSGFCVWV